MLDTAPLGCERRCELPERLKPRTVIRFCVVGTLFALTSLIIALSQHSSSPYASRSSAEAGSCGVWSLRGLLLDSPRTALEHTANGSVARTAWRHRRSGVYGALGIMTATVESCADGGKPSYGEGRLSAASTLCRGGGSGEGAGAVVLEVKEGTYDDLLPSGAANLWHFHAAALRLWVALRLVDAARYDRARKAPGGETPTLTMRHVERPVVLLLPLGAWRKLQLLADVVAFRAVADELQRLEGQGAAPSALEALQALGELLGGGGRVLVVRSDASPAELEGAQQAAGWARGVAAWVVPPHDAFHMYPGLLWDVAHDGKLESSLASCRRSLVQRYADEATAGAARGAARHVCLVSRQGRGVRNLHAAFYARLVRRLAAPIVLSPTLALQRANASRVPLALGGSSIAGQLRFVRRECAVLLGAHGAGLTNALALQRGAALVELLPPGAPMHYFRNVAALLADVTYDVVPMEAAGERQGANLTLDDARLDALVHLVNVRLQQSVWHQRT